MTKKISLIIGSIVITALLLVVFSSNLVKAAISVFAPSTCYTASATTSPKYMTAGTATSTVTCNLGGEGARVAFVTAEVNASSTSSIFNSYVEESMDGVDWFPVSMGQSASTTNPFSLNTKAYFTYTFASSTLNGVTTAVNGVNGTNNRNHYVFEVPVRMRQVRVYTVIPIGSSPGAVWMQINPKQDLN